MQWSGMIQLALDAGLKSARSARAGHRHGAGAVLLAGSHVVYPTKVHEDGGRPYLEAGPIHRSFWRTIEWRLWKPMVDGLERPIADVGCGDGEFGKSLFPAIDFGFDGAAATREAAVARPKTKRMVTSPMFTPGADTAHAFSPP